MICEICGAETKVVDSREYYNNTIRRRRECTECGNRFSTVEIKVGQLKVNFEDEVEKYE